MQPRVSQATEPAAGRPSRGTPPAEGAERAGVPSLFEPAGLVASRGGDASWDVDPVACRACGFVPPVHDDVVDALRRVPSVWDAALAVRPSLLDRQP